ncbi:MAG: hypothetical protein ACI9XK_004382 [Granulosicoccus sp.]|jgi:hypothetical protein
MIARASLLLAALLLSPQLSADQSVADKYISNAELVGKARLKVFFWSVFDAKLYAQNAKFSPEQPFALSLSYLREITGSEIVTQSISEMQAQNQYSKIELEEWEAQLSDIIPNVDSTTTITGVRDQAGATLFYKNGEIIGQIKNRRFTQGFFNIWLGPKTTQTKLRAQLLNLK